MKWIDEKVLQKYLKESFKEYGRWFEDEYNEKLVSVRYNHPFDAYPDLYGVLESGKNIPIEVEWTTKDFNHDPKIIEDSNGLVAVLQNNDPFFSLKQLELNKNKFQKWYIKNSERIFNESISEVIKNTRRSRRPPKLWFFYNSLSVKKNMEKTLSNGVYGVPYVFSQLDRFKDIRKNDLFCFVGPFEGLGGRIKFEKFKKKKIICKEFTIYKVSSDYYYDYAKIWDYDTKAIDPSKIKNYPHRFKFKKQGIFTLKDINIKTLSLTSKRVLHKLPYTKFWEGKPDVLVDLVSRSK